MPINPDPFRRPPTIHQTPVVVDDLPDDDVPWELNGSEPLPPPVRPPRVDEPSIILNANNYEPCTDFLAYVKGSRIGVSGEIHITLGIPFEYKYDALQLTDMRGVQFHVIVRQPKRYAVEARSTEQAND